MRRENCLVRRRWLWIPVGLALLMLALLATAPAGDTLSAAHAADVVAARVKEARTSTPRTEDNGALIVSVWKRGTWQPVGALAYGRWPAERTLALPGADPSRLALVRVQHAGTTHAYVDAIRLDGQPPRWLNGALEPADLALHKAALFDHDLIDLGGRAVVFAFERNRLQPTLSIVARIQPAYFAELPLLFPPQNTNRAMDDSASFYPYKLDSAPGRFAVDGDLGGETLGTPFFEVYHLTGSGHPAATTYGWVRNDTRTLYVAIDFLPDNTMDGDEDYATVYVRTPGDLRAFTVSMGATEWGRPGFVYTSRAPYQHKVYEFAIPFSALGVNPAEIGPDLELAFAAYGTAVAPAGEIDQFHPERNAVGAPINTVVSATYTGTFDVSLGQVQLVTTTVSSQTFVVHGLSGGMISGTYTFPVPETLIVTPDRPFHEGEKVHVMSTWNIRSTLAPPPPITGNTPNAGILPPIPVYPVLPQQWEFTAATVLSRCVGGFTDAGASLPGLTRSAGAWGDYDTDGDLDIVLTGLGTGGPATRILRNQGGSFSVDPAASAGLVDVADGAVAWGDYDNDGDPDLALTGNAGTAASPLPVSSMFENAPPGFVFDVLASGVFTDVYASSLAWGDINNDGLLDLLLTGNNSTTTAPRPVTALYRRNPISFTVDIATDILTGTLNGTASWADVNLSTAFDVLVSGGRGGSGPMTEIWVNGGLATWLLADIDAGLLPLTQSASDWGDFDGDGQIDLLLAGNAGTPSNPIPAAVVYRNVAGSGFVDAQADLAGVMDGSVEWGDYDNDGDLDILLSGMGRDGPLTKVYRNDGANAFTDIGAGLPPVTNGFATWGDFDNDHDLDILLSGQSTAGPITRIYRNGNCPDLSILKTSLVTEATPGSAITYTLAFSNIAPASSMTATGVIITDQVPAQIKDVSYSSSLPVTATGAAAFSWQIPDLAPGEGGVLTVTGILIHPIITGTVVLNTATIASEIGEESPSDNESTAQFKVLSVPTVYLPIILRQ